jgi:hypothetical protein
MVFVKSAGRSRADFFYRINGNGFHYYNSRRQDMSAGNGRGSMGAGPMTGRGSGYCAGNSAPGYVNPAGGGGFYGNGRGAAGRGRGNQFYSGGMNSRGRGFRNFQRRDEAGVNYSRPEFSSENELSILKEQAEFIQNELASVAERIKELESLSAGKSENS